MKNQELRSSLTKSAIILILCIFFIYAFASGDSGGITGTIGSLFSGVLFLIGLSVALIVSVAVLFGIYFLILYFYNPELCSSSYADMKTRIGELSESMGCGCCCVSSRTSSCDTSYTDTASEERYSSQDSSAKQVKAIQRALNTLQDTFDASDTVAKKSTILLATIETRLTSVEEDIASRPTAESIESIANQVSVELDKVRNSLSTVQGAISDIESELAALKSTTEENNADEQQSQIDTAVAEIKEELSTIQTAIASINEAASVTTASTNNKTVNKDGEHRILSYFSTEDDTKQFTTKVTIAVKKGMTYAEIADFLDDSLSVEASEVIADHPSLTKDYIRICRQSC